MKTELGNTPFTLVAESPKKPKQEKVKREKRHSKEFEKKCAKQCYVPPMASDDETTFRHSAWKTKRKLVRAALAACGTSDTTLDAFDQCGAECVVEYDQHQKKYRLRATYCHSRHCEPCNRAKANLLAANLRTRLLEKPDGRYRFITLTLLHSETPLAEQIDRLYASFKALRNRPIWKETQNGGAAILETKWDRETGLWHPHLHVISEGGFIDQAQLSSVWHDVTGDSYVVDIRALKEEKDAAYYVAKYVSKGTTDDVWANQLIAIEWICAMKGRRAAYTYGTWRGFKLLQHAENTGTWVKIGTLNGIYRDARDGMTYAIRLLDTLTKEIQFNPHRTREKKASNPP